MTTLMIKDLAVTEQLDRTAMSAVRGGSYQGMYKGTYSYGNPLDITKSSFALDASQVLVQSQETQVNNGNNVAFAHDITSTVKPQQTGANNINIGY